MARAVDATRGGEADDGRIDLGPGASIEPSRVQVSYVRSSGPGGQSVNKVATKVQMRISVTDVVGLSGAARDRLRSLAGRRLTTGDEIVLNCGASRSQSDNRRTCFDRLRRLVQAARVAPKVRRKTKPTRASKKRRIEGKRRRGDVKRGRGGSWDS